MLWLIQPLDNTMGYMTTPNLSDAERQIREAFPRGAWVDLRSGDPREDRLESASSWGPERLIRADVLRELLLGGKEPEPGYAPGLRLRGARVVGRLDLMGATVGWPLVCEYCYFDGEIRLVESSARTVRLVQSRIAAINAARMSLHGIFNLMGTTVAGVLRLDEAVISGHVCLSGTDIVTSQAPG